MIALAIATGQLVLTGYVAATFAAGGFTKAADRGRFRHALADYRLLPPLAVAPVARVVQLAEMGLAGGLVAFPGATAPRVGATALLIAFALAMAANLLRGRGDLDCGCATMPRRIDWRGVGGNAAMAFALLLRPATDMPPLLASQALLAGVLAVLLVAAASIPGRAVA